MEIFAKVITIPDIERRLSFSNGCLQASPQFKGIVLKVRDDDGNFWNFRCMIGSGFAPKLVMDWDWMKFVRRKDLHEGDTVILYKEEDMITGIEYKIQNITLQLNPDRPIHYLKQHGFPAMEIFSKVLTVPDLERRLSFSNGCLQALPPFKGCHGIVLQVKDEDGVFWNFSCMMIRSGFDPKLAMVSGWIKFVKSKGLQEGDMVVLDKEEDSIRFSGMGMGYRIRVKKNKL